ncbi:MAG: hypothetical protein WCO58_02830 [bacterium]
MKKEEFDQIKTSWKKLNEEYDGYIEEFLKTKNIEDFSGEKYTILKNMQTELFNIENKIFDLISGNTTLEK